MAQNRQGEGLKQAARLFAVDAKFFANILVAYPGDELDVAMTNDDHSSHLFVAPMLDADFRAVGPSAVDAVGAIALFDVANGMP